MTHMNFTTIIRNWCEQERGGSLLLPDGWYGQPYDNQHRLTSIDESDGMLTLVLDQKLTLCLQGLTVVEAGDGELVFGPFGRLGFRHEPYGSEETYGAKEYPPGEVKILSGLSQVKRSLLEPIMNVECRKRRRMW